MADCECAGEAISSSNSIDDLVIGQNCLVDCGHDIALHENCRGYYRRPLRAQFQEYSQLRMLGQQFPTDLVHHRVQVLIDHDRTIQPQQFCLIGRDVGDIIHQFLRDIIISSSAIQNNDLSLTVCVLRCGHVDLHRYLFLKEQVLGLIDDLLEVFIDVLQICEGHVGSTVDDDGVIPCRIHINVSHSGMLTLDHLPPQLHISRLHLFLQVTLGIIISDLPQKITPARQFPYRNCLVGSLPAIGSEVPMRLDGLANCWDLVDIQEVVGIGTPQHTDLLASLHKIYLNKSQRDSLQIK